MSRPTIIFPIVGDDSRPGPTARTDANGIAENITIWLEPPPSVNSLWRCSRGRFHRAPRYQQWLDLHSLITRPLNPIPAPVAIAITLHQGKGWGTNRDLDNIAKPIIDLLCHRGILDDDSTKTVRQITMRIHPAPDPKARARVEVTAETIKQQEPRKGEDNGVSYGSQPPPGGVGGDLEKKIGEGGKKNRH